MKEIQFLGKELTREEQKSIKGAKRILEPKKCITKSCKNTHDCGGALKCACYYNSPTESTGYCQVRANL